MKELTDILAAFETLCAERKPAALATVIGVEGSAYRPPGARMLVAQDGRTWGGVSGGCLERDVARRAIGVIETGRALRCVYDTADDESAAAGASTGCGGVVKLFIQPISESAPGPMPFFRQVVRDRKPVTIRTVIDPRAAGAGECSPVFGRTEAVVDAHTRNVSDSFVEHLKPPQSLVIFGAGSDVVPVVTMAKLIGWHVMIVASRPATGIHERFPTADAIAVTASDDPLAGVAIAPESAVVVMTHNIARDIAILGKLRGPVAYLGLLGPPHRTERVMQHLPGRRILGVDDSQLFNPVGLDLGAKTPEEIALSIISEIQATLRGASTLSLRELQQPIETAIAV